MTIQKSIPSKPIMKWMRLKFRFTVCNEWKHIHDDRKDISFLSTELRSSFVIMCNLKWEKINMRICEQAKWLTAMFTLYFEINNGSFCQTVGVYKLDCDVGLQDAGYNCKIIHFCPMNCFKIFYLSFQWVIACEWIRTHC